MGRIGISCLFPASWHFSISPVGCPRILNTNLCQIIVISLLAAAVSLLYFSVVIIRNKYGRLSKDKKFQRYLGSSLPTGAIYSCLKWLRGRPTLQETG
uniref:Uncharacterized protein n=1 Tax=Bos mutus grunniens TaxID=30521 RepID=A0A8C0AKR1_BOSMU